MNKNEMKMIEEMAKAMCERITKCKECLFNEYQYCIYHQGATALYNEGYRKVGKGKIVVKKSKIGMLEKTIDYLEMEKAQLYKQREQAEQETARKILHKIKDYIDNGLGGYLLIERKNIIELANALGIDLGE